MKKGGRGRCMLEREDRSYGMTPKQMDRFWKFIFGDDLDFYEEYIIHLSDEQQKKFFLDNPEFLSDLPIESDKIYLLKDEMFRGILRKIKKYERKQ